MKYLFPTLHRVTTTVHRTRTARILTHLLQHKTLEKHVFHNIQLRTEMKVIEIFFCYGSLRGHAKAVFAVVVINLG